MTTALLLVLIGSLISMLYIIQRLENNKD